MLLLATSALAAGLRHVIGLHYNEIGLTSGEELHLSILGLDMRPGGDWANLERRPGWAYILRATRLPTSILRDAK